MKNLLEVCLVVSIVAVMTTAAFTQSVAEIPLQRGISVDLPVSSNAVAVPAADKEDALVVTVTHSSSVYFGVNPIRMADLGMVVRSAVAGQAEKTLYIKADARLPYGSLVKVLDAVQTAGAERITLLTGQRDEETPGALAPPKGLEMKMVRPRQ